MATWRIHDSTTTKLTGFDLGWLSSEAYAYITPHVGKGFPTSSIALEAGPYAGAIPLINGDTLYIVPRLGKGMFSRMLLVGEGLDQAIREEFRELVQMGIDASEDTPWSSLLARPFIDRLKLIEKSSLMPGRIKMTDRKFLARGKILAGPTLLALARNEETPIACEFSTKSHHILENRLLAAAALVLLRLEAIAPASSDYKVAARWTSLVGNRIVTENEISEVMARMETGRYMGSRAYYFPALLMARLILSSAGVSLSSDLSVKSSPILANLPLLYEAYIRRTLAMGLLSWGLVVEKLSGPRAPALFLDGVCKLEPDIIISSSLGVKLLCDVKYKPEGGGDK